MPNPLFLGIKDKDKKLANKAQNKSTVASTATKSAASAARTTERNTDDTDALLSQNSKIGNNAEKYESAGRIGGFDRRQTPSTSAVSTAKTKLTSLESALLQGSARESESNAGLLADALFQSRYGTAL